MSGANGLAKRHLEGSPEEAHALGIDERLLGRAMLATVVDAYKAQHRAADPRFVLEFQMENLDDDVDHPFMRL